MQSASTTGILRWAAAISACVPLPPPISTDITARNLEAAEFLLHLDRAGDVAAVGQAFLTDQRCPHVGDDSDTIVIIKIQRRHQLHAVAFRVEPAQVEQAQIGAAAATGAENPGADGEGFDILKRNLGEGWLIHATSSSTARAAAAMARMTGPP